MSPESAVAALLLIVLSIIDIVPLLILCQVVVPGVHSRSIHTIERMPIRSFLIGLVNSGFFGLIALALLSGPAPLKFAGLLVATILLSFIVLGLSAVAGLLGARMRPLQTDPIRQSLIGGLTLVLSALVPLVGWLVVPLLAGLTGYGAVIIALVWHRSAPKETL